MMRSYVPLNHDWLYLAKNLAGARERRCDERAFTPVCLPHTNIELPWHDFDDKEYQFVSWYRRRLSAPRAWRGKRLHLEFEAAMAAAEVWVNGRHVGGHKGGYTPFTLDITDAVEPGPDNVVAVKVDSRERKDIPPFGNVVDYLTFGGIYREVGLTVLDPAHIADVFARSRGTSLDVTVEVVNDGADPVRADVTASLGGKSASTPVDLAPGERRAVDLKLRGLPVKPWSLDAPNLYTLNVELGKRDAVSKRIGFREARFAEDGKFYLNGKHVQLFGLDRHQTFPYVGGAMAGRAQRRDADILKYELGLNIVRTSHYPQSRHFLDRCDEIGLLVFEEIPGWQHIGDEAWKNVSKNELREMILRDRNHPSIVLWGVRINESPDDHDFYTETNRIAHELDPTRQTGGVRCFRESEFLEDVFTYNDFSNTVLEPNHRPYLITEFNGHMFPTKPYDQEERMVEHALRHARIQDKQMGTPGVAGAIGWCAFDYDTHQNFGSGDRICYHGVMDIFRFPKFAAHFYKSQLDPSVAVVLEPATYLKWGERSVGGFDPAVVFTNCEEVEAWRAGERISVLRPNRKDFPNLPNPPFVGEGLNHYPWTHDVEFVGKIKGRIVARRKIACDGVPRALHLFADDKKLLADGSDTTRVGFALTDRYGNILPFATGVVTLELTGPGRLIGENPFALVAGRGALWLRAGHKKGVAKITAHTPRFTSKTVSVRIG